MLATEGFAAHVWGNQLRSILLLMGFPVLLLLMLGGFFGALGMLSTHQFDLAQGWLAAKGGMLQYGQWAVIAAGAWFVIAYFFHGRMMAAATGAQDITRQQMPKIYNMLENLCISRGIPMPQFQIIDSPAMNAFATGIDEKSYRIVLTRGIVEKLQDDELESVIAHELTHIRNRDCRLLIISVIFVGMISFLCQMLFRTMMYGSRPNYYSRGNSRNNGNGGLVLLFVGLAVLAIGYVFAIAIRFALSRRREYLADAGSVELTKNPDAMMRALMRISGQDQVQGLPSEVAQMCIENSVDFMGMFATHPKIEDRINVISRTTGTPVPTLPVSLRRAPERPWDGGQPPPPPPQRPWG